MHLLRNRPISAVSLYWNPRGYPVICGRSYNHLMAMVCRTQALITASRPFAVRPQALITVSRPFAVRLQALITASRPFTVRPQALITASRPFAVRPQP